MQNIEILDYLKAVGKPVYFRTIANWFPGEAEEAELFRRLRLLIEGGYVRRLKGGKIEVIR